MNLIVLEKKNVLEMDTFIGFWSNLYFYPKEELYNNSINKSYFTKLDIQNLYLWKNGMKLSTLKQASLDKKVIAKLALINDLKSANELDLNHFHINFKDLSSVWKLFLLHIIKPTQFPIYDQHIHRTYLFINNLEWLNFSNNSIKDKLKEEFYFNSYLEFINANKVKDLKRMDEAFFAFGQLINTRKNHKLVQ